MCHRHVAEKEKAFLCHVAREVKADRDAVDSFCDPCDMSKFLLFRYLHPNVISIVTDHTLLHSSVPSKVARSTVAGSLPSWRQDAQILFLVFLSCERISCLVSIDHLREVLQQFLWIHLVRFLMNAVLFFKSSSSQTPATHWTIDAVHFWVIDEGLNLRHLPRTGNFGMFMMEVFCISICNL